MRVTYVGDHSVEYQGEVWKAPRPTRGVLPQYARHLLSCGVPPDTPLEALRDGTCVFKPGLTVGDWASKTVSENDTSATFKKYIPFDEGVFD